MLSQRIYYYMYQIVLTENRVKIKVLYSYIRKRDGLFRFNKIKETESLMPKETIYRGKELVKVKYEVLLVKQHEEGEENVVVKDKYGRETKIKTDDGDWTVLGVCDYFIDEQFKVSGANRKLTAEEILNHILLNNNSDTNMKQVVILNNKVVIEGFNIYMVICKNIAQAIRLYNILRTHCYDNNIGSIVFFGTVPKENKKTWYKKLHERTGVGYNRLYRTSSR